MAKASVGSAVVGGGGQVCSKPWHNHALVLVGAATAVLPRGALVSAAKICGARWVSRYELGDQRSLPEDVNPVMAKALADQLPSCVSVDENETGLGEKCNDDLCAFEVEATCSLSLSLFPLSL